LTSELHYPAVLFKKVTLVGVGLLGGSLGLILKQRRLAGRVEGYVRRELSIGECQSLGVVDCATCDLEAAVREAELVVLCTPLAQMRELTERMLPHLNPGTIITDVGSVKASVVRELEPLLTDTRVHFIGSHPMAGGEKMGVSAARADLYQNAVCVVTPTATSDADALNKVEELWAAVGMRILTVSPELHDELVSRSSHLPHVVAAELANFVLDPTHPNGQAELCANGFRDTTRIASGSPEMWRDIAMANRENLSNGVARFIERLQQFQQALDRQDAKAVEEFFATAKDRRDNWRVNAGPGTSK
jgi:prephenate dehydrogenase